MRGRFRTIMTLYGGVPTRMPDEEEGQSDEPRTQAPGSPNALLIQDNQRLQQVAQLREATEQRIWWEKNQYLFFLAHMVLSVKFSFFLLHFTVSSFSSNIPPSENELLEGIMKGMIMGYAVLNIMQAFGRHENFSNQLGPSGGTPQDRNRLRVLLLCALLSVSSGVGYIVSDFAYRISRRSPEYVDSFFSVQILLISLSLKFVENASVGLKHLSLALRNKYYFSAAITSLNIAGPGLGALGIYLAYFMGHNTIGDTLLGVGAFLVATADILNAGWAVRRRFFPSLQAPTQ